MLKKMFSIMVAFVLVLSISACNSGGSKTDDTPTGAQESNKLTVWCWDPAFNLYAMEEAEKLYQKTHPDFDLEIVETPWDDIQTFINTAGQSGKIDGMPDILLIQDNAFQKNVMAYPELFTDITNSGIDFSKFGKAKTAYSVIDGKNYGVPFDNGAVIGCYRTDVLEQAGYKVEDFTDITWSKYLEMGKDILAKTGKPLLSCQAGESDVIMMMLQSAGASLFDEEGKPNIVNNDVLKKVMKTYIDLKKSGVLIEVNSWDEYVGSITNGTVAGTINGCWIMASIQTAEDQSGKWAITNMPKLDDVPGATNYSNNGGSSWAISSNCKNVDLAVDFLKSTFAGSVEFYETILPKSGALATYLPAANSDVYEQPQEFFGGAAVYALITDFASKIPSNNTGAFYYEARSAVATAISNVINNEADLDKELKAAQENVEFYHNR